MVLAPAPAPGCPIDQMRRCPVGDARDFDPFAPAYLEDPAQYLRWAREEQPVFWSERLGYWVVTSYDDVKSVFRDHRNFSPANALEKITPPTREVQQTLASYGYAMDRTLVNEDEPAHMARRRLLLEPFTPEAVKHHEPLVRKLVREYVDRFIDRGRADLVDEMLWEVPLTVALHFLGFDEDDMPMLRRYSIAHTINTWGRPDEKKQLEVAHAVGNFWQLSGRILEKMRRDPAAPGWMRLGIRMQAEHPDIVTDSYLHSMMMAGIVAAHETTANATANGLLALLRHPTAWREICEQPQLIPNAVEECLRVGGPIVAWRRVVLNEVRVGEVTLPAGAKVLMVMASGNHDGRHFADADELNIHRDNAGDHLSFGYGAHQCLGKNLARLELQIFIEELSRRLPHMRLAAQQLAYLPNISFRGPEHLWVEWDPQRNPERHDPDVLRSRQDVRIGESPRAPTARMMRVAAARPVAQNVMELTLVPSDGRPLQRWTPGAHIDVDCGDTGLSRQYSLCGDPEDVTHLRLAVLREQPGRGGSAWIHANVKAGDSLRVRGPRNNFRFDESALHATLVAGGIGITPISAMARRAKQLGIDYVLHYSGRSRSTMPYVEELADLHRDRMRLHISDEGTRADYAQLLEQLAPATSVYVCGPQRMVDAIQALAVTWPADRLRVERFRREPNALEEGSAHAFEVELRDTGQVVQVPSDQTLLQALRAANIDVPSDCCEGLCGTCEVRVLEGAIDHRDVVLTQAEREQNSKMMSCCSRAKGARLVLAL